MSINLVKGQKINLTKESHGLSKLLVGLGWDPVKKGWFSKAQDVDIDASVFMLRNGKFTKTNDIIYYGNLKSETGAVIHTGDNLTGDAEGDDETILVDLSKIPQEVDRLIFVTNIYKADARKQHFGLVKNAYIRIADQSAPNTNIAKFNLSDNYEGYTAMIVGEVYRRDNEWKFSAIGEGTHDLGLNDMSLRYR